MRTCPFSGNTSISKRVCDQCAFQSISLCNSLSASDMQTLLDLGNVVTFNKGELIYKQDLRPNGLICQLSAVVKLVKLNNLGGEDIVSLHKPVDLLGITEIISEIPYQYSAIAMEETQVNIIPISKFLDLLQTNPMFSFKISKYLTKKILDSHHRTEKFTKKHLRGRLADTLLALHQICRFKSDTDLIDLQISRADLASYSNMTTSNAIRTLSEFSGSGLVKLEGKKIRILNWEELKRLSKFG
jgi:CRP-like cAMP-binding protein